MTHDRLRPLLLMALVFSSLAQISFAQIDSTGSNNPYPFYMMDFGVRGNFTVGSFLGPAISLSRVEDPFTRWRFGLGASITPYQGDENRDLYYADTLTYIDERSYSGGFYSITLVAQKLHFAQTRSAFRMYVGWGPIVTGSYRDQQDEVTSRSPSGSTSRQRVERREYSWLIGLSGVAGVEWEFSDGMALHAEYGMQATYSRSSTKQTSTQTFNTDPPSKDQREYSNWGGSLVSSGVLFGLSIAL